MIRRASAHSRCVLAAAMSVAEAARAGVWSTEPVLGLQTDYSTNPQLTAARHTATTDGAVLIDAPTTYSANGWSFVVQPSVRYTDISGYASLESNYQHLTAMGKLDGERNSIKATAIAERDSSLYQPYNVNGSNGVRQDTAMADVAWVRSLTERLNFNVDGSYSQIRYGQSAGVSSLTDYAYSSASPSVSWQASERTTLTGSGGFSLYDSLNGTTRSTDANIELGLTRQLSELWSLSIKAGLSREKNRIKEYSGSSLLGTYQSSTNGTVYSGNLTRQGAVLGTTFVASRSLVPAGFSFLSRRDSYELQTSYPHSERWTFQGYVRHRNEQNPQSLGPAIDVKYTDLGVSAVWLMAEHWTVTVTASRVSEKYGSSQIQTAEGALSVQLSRKFNRFEWH